MQLLPVPTGAPARIQAAFFLFALHGYIKRNRSPLIAAAITGVAGLTGICDPGISALGVSIFLTVNTLGGGGSVTGSLASNSGGVITVVTVSATADYAHEVDMMAVPHDGSYTSGGSFSGTFWFGWTPCDSPGVEGLNIRANGVTSQFGTNNFGARTKVKVGPGAAVTAVYQNRTANTPTYYVAYNYLGYKVS